MSPRETTALRRLWAGLPATRIARVFLLVTFVDAAGRGLFLAGSVLFYTQVIHLTDAQVGFGLSMAGLAGLLCALPIGRLADRAGAARTLTLLQLWRALLFALYPFVRGFGEFLVVASLIGAAEWAVGPIIQSVAGIIAGDNSYVRTMALVTVVRNVGYAMAAMIATIVISTAGTAGYVALVSTNAAAFLVTAALLIQLKLGRPAPPTMPADPGGRRRLSLRMLPFLTLTTANGILYLHATILSVALPLWIVTRTTAPRYLVGLALVVNTIMAVTLQVPLSRGGDLIHVAARKQLYAGVALAACCVMIGLSGSAGAIVSSLLLLASMGMLTLGEIWQSAGAWGLSYGLSPESRRTSYLSIYGLGATGLTVVGPSLLAISVVDRGDAGWYWLAVVFVVTALAIPAITRLAERRPLTG
jgi:MFS family permease